MIKIVVCDDEKKILNTLSEKISQTFLNKDMEIRIFETTSPTKALEYIKSNVVDVVFLVV